MTVSISLSGPADEVVRMHQRLARLASEVGATYRDAPPLHAFPGDRSGIHAVRDRRDTSSLAASAGGER